ncbi:MAG: insulinase family protein, partial [Kofleriaceae bacterium]
GAIAFNEVAHLTSKWPKADPRYTESTTEQIASLQKVQLADIVRLYKGFAGAGHGELAVVGDFDLAATGASIEKLFAKWQTKQPYTRLDNKPWGVAGQEKSINLKDKEQTTVAIAFDVPMKDTDPDYAPWLVASQVLGGYTGSRLWMRLREHEGLSYGVATWSYAGALDDLGGFGGYAIVAPQNLTKAKASLVEEFTRMASAQVPADELQKAKDAWLDEQDTSLSNDDFQVEMLANQLFRHRTTQFTKELRVKLRAVTSADVQRVARKYYDQTRLTIVDAGDQAKARAN